MADDNQAQESTRLISNSNHAPTQTENHWPAISLIVGVLLILSIGGHITLVAETAVLQEILCCRYYANPASVLTISEHLGIRDCQIEPIQSEVARINGWRGVTETLPALLVAIPYGALTNRLGRKPAFILSFVGLFLNDLWVRIVYWFADYLPLWLVLLGGLWHVVGGGAVTLTAVAYVLIADKCPADQRTTAFSAAGACNLISQMIFVPIGGALIKINGWIPMLLSLLFTIIAVIIAVLFVTDTLPPNSSNSNSDAGANGDETSPPTTNDTITASNRVLKQMTNAGEPGRWLAANGRLGLGLLFFLALSFGEEAGRSILLQYSAKRLNWTLGQTSIFLSLGAGIHLLDLMVLLPALSAYLVHLGFHEQRKDKFLVQVSGAVFALGTIAVCFARSWPFLALAHVIASLGTAATVPARSLVTRMVHSEHLGALYTAISVVLYAGTLVGSPVLAATLQVGMRTGGQWLGMPFLVAGGSVFMATLAITFGIRQE